MTATALSLTLAALSLTVSLAGPALAATTISTATTVPVNTTTTGDLTVNSSGSITLTTGTAITVNSDNDVTLDGKIDMAKSAAGSTGIWVDGGRTADLTIKANITVTDDFVATDSKNADTLVDGPFADSATRYGIRSTGATPFVGNVVISSASTIAVEGSNSYGVRFENNVQGNLTMDGTIKMEGDNNTAVALENGVTGSTYLSGTIQTRGTNSSAVKLAGEFDGSVVIDGTYSGTGYAATERAGNDAMKKILATPEDMGQSGVLVDIAGNVDKGILIGAALTSTVDDAINDDEDGNGIIDSSQTIAALTSYGAAPALRIASATQDLTIGGLVYDSSAINMPTINYALAIRGNVLGNGLYRNVDATGVQLGGVAGGRSVSLANGVQVKGNVIGRAYGGTSTALLFGAGATTPLLDIEGTIQSVAERDILSTTTGTTTTYDAVAAHARGIDIAAGANLPTINVKKGGSVAATSLGSKNTTIAIRDQSNTLTQITNNAGISATVQATDDDGDKVADTILTRAVAIDTRTNTVGLTLNQVDVAPGDTKAETDIPAPFINGDILLGSGNDAVSSSGGLIAGSIDFGAGNDSLTLAAKASHLGNIDFGAGSNSFALSGKASYLGKATGTGTVALDISDGLVFFQAGTNLNTTTVNVGATSTLGVVLDVDSPTAALFTGSGAVTIANGATIDVAPSKVFTAPKTFTVLTTTSTVSLGTVTTRIPYVYHVDVAKGALTTGGEALTANVRLKTQAEAEYSNNQYAALVPVLTVMGQDVLGSRAVLTEYTREGFDRVYNQYLPDYSGENILGLSLGSTSLNRSLGSLSLIPTNGAGQYWLQEYGYQTKRDYADTAGFESTGFSFAGGRESEVYGNQTIGFYLSYTSATPADTFAISEEEMINSDVTVGGYWRLKTGAFKGWAHAGVGFTNFESIRQNSTLAYTSKAEWGGFSYSGGVGASVDYKLGKLSVTPMVLADYYALSEEEHSESGGGDYFDLSIGERDSHLLSSTAMINFSYGRFFLKPELWFGYKQNISAEIANTIANFKNGTAFTLSGGDLEGGGPIAGFRISADNEWSYFGLEGDFEQQDTYTNYSIALRTRFQF
ncbi:autotransporter outer membrane beta-barrel domain-containing protein [Asticcacaulis sp. AC402]|uniref:autotransporter outer membrane beta-barrel domain-containing protein n=1 Tax=Asticcacaulis sp. AC402 TaxID=1282361 RepID=UPI001F2792B5|nr:autotransporter outer membrane beta-barrel domain-containing protein [Asticcacaulis sp. AC402]